MELVKKVEKLSYEYCKGKTLRELGVNKLEDITNLPLQMRGIDSSREFIDYMIESLGEIRDRGIYRRMRSQYYQKSGDEDWEATLMKVRAAEELIHDTRMKMIDILYK